MDETNASAPGPGISAIGEASVIAGNTVTGSNPTIALDAVDAAICGEG